MTTSRYKDINLTLEIACQHFRPPEKLTVSEWAERHRVLVSDSSAEPGPWKTSRTPYLQAVMDTLTDPKVRRIVFVASSQVGKSEALLNIIGYIIDQQPGGILFGHPSVEDARKFSRQRIAPMIRACDRLKGKVSLAKGRDAANTVLQKTFPGGSLTMVGSNSPSGLASLPIKYVFGDERDRWALSAGTEGDPWGLAEARALTFMDSKLVEVSTPTIKGHSAIEDSYTLGTQERWCHQCPACGEWHEINFDCINFDHECRDKEGRPVYKITKLNYACPGCGVLSSEKVMKRQPAKWIAENPEALANGTRSFWLTGFASPWMTWEYIVLKFLEANGDPLKLKVVYNTLFGKLWEDRGEVDDPEEVARRAEAYDAELPEGVLVLTCGVDTQDDRLEYEIVGHGRWDEKWGIKKGVILGRPDGDDVWLALDEVIDREYTYRDGRKLKISVTFVDSGGHYTQDVYYQCWLRMGKKVFAIKGKGGDGIAYTKAPTKIDIVVNGRKRKTWIYVLGVDAGKAAIVNSLKVQEPGPKYCHFPADPTRGYDLEYYNGLLSEKLTLKRERGRDRWTWVKIHERNEPFDCRNYANAAFKALDPDLDAIERRLKAGHAKSGKVKAGQRNLATSRHINTAKSTSQDEDYW